jgi:uncharacterized protein (DUF1015 family)
MDDVPDRGTSRLASGCQLLAPAEPRRLDTVDARPFRGLRYHLPAIGDLGLVLGPPDDVLSRTAALAFAAAHPRHSLWLEVPDPDGAHFTEAATRLRGWQAEGVLQFDPEPAFYLYEHRYVFAPEPRSRFGVFVALRLDEAGRYSVLPHESVTPTVLAQRLSLLRTARANLSAVYTLAPASGRLAAVLREIAAVEPVTVIAENGSGQHKLWVLSGPAAIDTVRQALSGFPVVIADGHHRYAAARRYRQELRQAGLHSGPADFALAHIVDADDPGILVRPIHRVVRAFGTVSWPDFLAHLQQHFAMETVPLSSAGDLATVEAAVQALAEERGWPVYLALAPGGRELIRLRLREWAAVDGLLPRQRSDVYRRLDATVFESVVLQHLLGLDGPLREAVVAFTPEVDEAVRLVGQRAARAAFFLRPTPLQDVLAVARAGEVMPPKSTYFFPKIPLGLVFYDLAGPAPEER